MGNGMEDKAGVTQFIVNEVCITTKRIASAKDSKKRWNLNFVKT